MEGAEEEEEEQDSKYQINRAKAAEPQQEEEHCGKMAQQKLVEPCAWGHRHC